VFRLKNCGVKVEGVSVFEGVNFEAKQGEKIVLLGSNGSGKSTLLRLLGGLVFASGGEYEFDGVRIEAKSLRARDIHLHFRRSVQLLFQNFDAMLFNPTVYDEIAFGPRQLGFDDVDARVRNYAEVLDLTSLLEAVPFRLSGGQKQKVALACALAMSPKLLLLDEPTSALDPKSTARLVDIVSALGCTVITATHNLALAQDFGTRAVVLSENKGIIFDGLTEHALEPSLLERAGLIIPKRTAT